MKLVLAALLIIAGCSTAPDTLGDGTECAWENSPKWFGNRQGHCVTPVGTEILNAPTHSRLMRCIWVRDTGVVDCGLLK